VIWYMPIYYHVVRRSVLPCVLQCIAVDCIVLQRVVVRCSVLQCVAVCR